MDDKKKSVDFWSGAGVEFDAKKALEALAKKVTADVKNNPDFWMDAPRLVLALQTKPRTSESKPESSIFQAFKGFPAQNLKYAGVKIDADKGQITFTGFVEGAKGLVELDAFLTACGALRRTTITRSKGWPFVSDEKLAATPKLAPHERVGSIPNAKQISIALPPQIALALPNWAGASLMVGFFVECNKQGITASDLEAFLTSKRAEKEKAEKEKAEKEKAEKEKADNTDNNDNNNDEPEAST